MSLEKVGRLKPDEASDSIRVIVDNAGEIGRIRRERMEMMVTGLELVMGSSDVVIELRIGEEMIRVLGWQVKGMMEKWPRKKAVVWRQAGLKGCIKKLRGFTPGTRNGVYFPVSPGYFPDYFFYSIQHLWRFLHRTELIRNH